jgi:predicted GNAT family acetyltransferase
MGKENTPDRMCRQGEEDREKIMAYLRTEPEYNLFLIGDIENHGMSADFQDVMAYEHGGRLDSVLLRYHTSYIPYSQYDDFESQPLLTALDTPNLRFLSGKKAVMDRLRPHFPDFSWKNSYLMRLETADLDSSGENHPELPDAVMKIASADDIPRLVDFLMGIAEFSGDGAREERISRLTKAIAPGGGSRYYLYWQAGRVIASAGTAAENSISAMVIAVATAPDRRGLGLASRLVTALSRDLLSGRLQYLCLFYNNPDAGRIYRRLGFKDAGEWIMAHPPDPIPRETDE